MSANEPDLPDYGRLLGLDTLLAHTLLEDRDLDRSLFLVTHQVCEIWFALMLRTLEQARGDLWDGRPRGATARLRRLPSIVDVLIDQFDVLATLSPEAFGRIRSGVGNASGFQSSQWREIEFLCGLKDQRFVNTRGLADNERARLRMRLDEPSVADALQRCAAYPTTSGTELRDVTDAMLAVDERVVVWRSRHAVLAERFIGTASGTGGSEGAAYLWRATGRRLFPAAWPGGSPGGSTGGSPGGSAADATRATGGDEPAPVGCPVIPTEVLGSCLADAQQPVGERG